MQNVREAVALVGIVWRTLVQWPALRKGVIVPGTEEPACPLHAVQKDKGHQESFEPAALLALKESAFKIVHDRLAELRSTLLCRCPQLAA